MKRLTLILLMGIIAMFLASCGGGPKPITDEEPVIEEPVVEEPVVEEPVVEEPVVEEPEPIKESDFMTVYYDFDKYNLVDSAKAVLNNNAGVLRDNPNVIILIEGHCDERGTVEYNLSLGEKRANSAMEYLKDLGIGEERMSIISYGKERPDAMGHTEAAWSKNRRAEFKIVSQ